MTPGNAVPSSSGGPGTGAETAGAGRRPRIALLTAYDPADRKTWSGIAHYVVQALEKHVGTVVPLGPHHPIERRFGQALSLLYSRMLGRRYHYMHTTLLSKAYGRHYSARLSRETVDFVFACSASPEVAYLNTPLPVMLMADATFAGLVDYYPVVTGLSDANLREGHETERRAIARSDALLYTSDWAARSAVADYGAPEAKAHVVQMGANIDVSPPADKVAQRVRGDVFHILFLGVDWQRKGGPIAWDAFRALEAGGARVRMTICGCTPPPEVAGPNLKVIPFLNKGDPAQYAEFCALMYSSDLLLLPTRADCTPVVFAEASAYGIPTLSTITGGVPSLVKDGVNGFTLAYTAGGADYATVIRRLIDNPEEHRALGVSARRFFEEVLNWDAWGMRVAQIWQEIRRG